MTTPFIFVTTHEVDPRRQDEFRALTAEYTEFVRANEPTMLAHHTYLDPERSEVSLVQIHKDAASADRHLQLVEPMLARAGELSRPVRVEVYGEPGPVVAKALRANADRGVVVTVSPATLPGFTRAA
ncbi:antibiotic biosynthesis monooxygenase [Actinopolymorpha sp. B17G11]|uniref:antibiotic biosynthesis monooxygenase n=1 Tax=unclassified Actinopolymorpha TaxID=2627063 RepID=UPI0032D96A90